MLKCSNREDLSKIICPYFISITRPISLKTKSPPSKSSKTTTAQKAYKQSFWSLCGSVAPCLIKSLFASSCKPKFIAKLLKNDKLVLIFGISILNKEYNSGKLYWINFATKDSNFIINGNSWSFKDKI